MRHPPDELTKFYDMLIVWGVCMVSVFGLGLAIAYSLGAFG